MAPLNKTEIKALIIAEIQNGHHTEWQLRMDVVKMLLYVIES